MVYVLAGHGSSGATYLNSPAWGESFPERIDRLIVSGAMAPVIAVLPDCFTIFGGAQYHQQLGARALRGLSGRGDHPLRRPRPTAPCRTGRTGRSPARAAAATGRWCSRCGIPSCSARWRTIQGDIYFEFGLLPDLAKLHANLMRFGGVEGFIAADRDVQAEDARPVLLGAGDALLRRGLRAEPGGAARVRHADRHGDRGAARGRLARWLEWDPVRMIDRPEYLAAWRRMAYIYSTAGSGTS